jgi:hypothetical protein
MVGEEGGRCMSRLKKRDQRTWALGTSAIQASIILYSARSNVVNESKSRCGLTRRHEFERVLGIVTRLNRIIKDLRNLTQ